MSLATLNRRNEITVQIYNESEPIRDEGGLPTRTVTDPIDIRILLMHQRSRVRRRSQNGERYVEDVFTFQISKRELDNKSFTLIRGRTFIIYNENSYRVSTVKDYSMYRQTGTYQCEAVRILNGVN